MTIESTPEQSAIKELSANIEGILEHPNFRPVPIAFMGRVSQLEWDGVDPETRAAMSDGLVAYVGIQEEKTQDSDSALMSIAGIAKSLGVTRQRVSYMYNKQGTLPEPFALVDNKTPVWKSSVIDEFIQSRKENQQQ